MRAKQFSSRFSSFWNSVAPRLAHYVKTVNLAPERFDVPVEFSSDVKYRPIVSDAALHTAALTISERGLSIPSSFTNIKAALQRVVDQPSPIQRIEFEPGDLPKVAKDVGLLSSQVIQYLLGVRAKPHAIHIEHELRGCGIVEASKCDIQYENTIVELKNVSGGFKSEHYRQLFTYAALTYADEPGAIEEVCLVNCSLGVYDCRSLNGLAADVSGLSWSELATALIAFMSSEIASTGRDGQ